MTKQKIGGIIRQGNLVMIKMLGIPNQPGAAGKLFTLLGKANINLHFIAESEDILNRANITVCVESDVESGAMKTLRDNSKDWDQISLTSEPNVTALTVYGPHFREKPTICGNLCSALGTNNINILGISTSISSICCLIHDRDVDRAYDGLLDIFELP